MKKTILFIFLTFLFTQYLFSQSGWVVYNININKPMKNMRFVNANTGFLVGDTNFVFKSTNGGLNWSSRMLPYSYPIILSAIGFLNENTGYTGGGFYSGNYFYYTYIFKTTNCGENWIKIFDSQGSIQGDITTIIPINDSVVFLSASGVIEINSMGGVFKSTNGGVNFSYMGIGNCCDAMSFINSYTGIVTSYFFNDYQTPKSRIYKTTNGCASWVVQFQDSSSNSTGFAKMQIINANVHYGLGARNQVRFFSTTNGGNNWSYTQSSNGRYKAMYFFNALTGWIGGYFGSDSCIVSYTSNGGLNWLLQKKNYNSTVNDIYFINEFTGWALLNDYKIMKTTNSGLTGILENEKTVPKYYSLLQNYPNPFNPTTNIKFSIPENGNLKMGNGDVTLKIYNILGKEVATLVNEKLHAGTYEIKWDGFAYPSGIYFYKLSVGDYSETKKMILIK